MSEKVKMKFKDAPLGARFKYPNMKKTWVKISDELIAEWKGNVKGFQAICSFTDEVVELI